MRSSTLRFTDHDTSTAATTSVIAATRSEERNRRVRKVMRSRDQQVPGVSISQELVAELLDRFDGVVEYGQLLTQAPDVHVDRSGAAGVLVPPDVSQQQIPRQHAAA